MIVYWKGLVWILTVACVLMSASYTMLIPFLPMYLIDELGVHANEVNMWSGVIFSASFLVSAIMAPIWGAIADKKSHKLMALRAATFLAISYGWGAIVSSPWELLWMRCFQGFSAGLWPACLAIMTASAPRDKMGWCLGIMQGGMTAGGVLGPFLGGVLAEGFGMRTSFWIGAVGLAIIAVLIAVYVKDTDEQKAARAKGGDKKKTGGAMELLRIPVIQRMLFAAGVVQLAIMIVQPILPLYIAELQGSTDNIVMVTGIVFSVVGISGVIASPIWGRVGGNVGYRPALYAALFGVGVFGVIQALPESITLFVVWRFIGGLFAAGIFPAINALLAENTEPNQRGRVFGLSYSAQQVGSVIGPILGGGLATFASNQMVVMSHGIVLLLLVLMLYLKRPKQPTQASGGELDEAQR
jgi:DHA1 family multidrug resistance protein-like MFS transporter